MNEKMVFSGKKSIRVGVSSHSLSGLNDGISHTTRQLIDRLGRVGISTFEVEFGQQRSNLGQNKFSLGYSYSFSAMLSFFLGENFRRLDAPIDLFHSTDFRLLPMRCPVVATVWDLIRITHPEWGRRKLSSYLKARILKHSIKYSDHIITSSKYVAGQLMELFLIEPHLISVIPWAIDDCWFQAVEQSVMRRVLEKYQLIPGYFLSVGTLQPRKNLDFLIDAYSLLPIHVRRSRKLVIVGRCGWNCSKLVSRLLKLQSQGEVVWLSNVNSDADLRCIYQGAGVFAFPSLSEGFGVPLLEAFASGVPVVSSNASCLPEISDGAALEVSPLSIVEFSDALKYLATDSTERERRRQLGRVRASQFSWDKTFAEILHVYDRVIERFGLRGK